MARRSRWTPRPGRRRATVVGAGSFGTAIAAVLARAGLRTTLQPRTATHAGELLESRENATYLPGVALPRELQIVPIEDGIARGDFVLIGVPSSGFASAVAMVAAADIPHDAAVVSLTKGLVPPEGELPLAVLRRTFGSARVACLAGPAHAKEMVRAGAALVVASSSQRLAETLAETFLHGGVVCESSNDPLGVELAGVAKNAAALASAATVAQGLNAAGAAAGHIFAEVWRYAGARGARPESMIGLAGTGDLMATALAGPSRNRRAGELLAEGVPAAEIPARVGQAIEAFDSVPLLARLLRTGAVDAPVTQALAELIAGELPVDGWVARVRTTVPPTLPRWRPGFWRRLRDTLRDWWRSRSDGR